MDVPINIPGFDQFIPSLPFGAVIFIKGGVDPAKTFFALHLVEAANKAGKAVCVVASRSGTEVKRLIQEYFPASKETTIIEASDDDFGREIQPDSLMVVDSFSFLIMNCDDKSVLDKIREMKLASKNRNSLFVLVMDDNMLDERTESMLLHYADGLIKFMNVQNPDGIKRFMRIPLWIYGTSFDDNIFYTFNDGRLSVDLRYRVV